MRRSIGVLLAVLVLAVFASGCVETECETSADCLTKTCFAAQCTDNKCVYSSITNCCGNEICEVGENYTGCAADCPNCDDKNSCTVDEYDYHEQKCVNTPILDVVCCGNGVCETGETYSNCARDCQNCDDGNECTKDSYDYHAQKCVNEVIIPCCGNGICDESAETYSSCPADCPNCDDYNRLTADSFNYTAQKCENVVTHYFIEDFESGVQNWMFHDIEGKTTTAWHTTMENSNIVLRGTGHNWAKLEGKSWTNYIFKARFKIINGAMHFNYRFNSEGSTFTRYMVGVNNNSMSLGKSTDSTTHINLVGGTHVQLDENWHTFEIRGYDNILNVYIDDELLIKYKDTESPILSGGVAFETLDNSEFLLDDVEIKLITEEDMTYP